VERAFGALVVEFAMRADLPQKVADFYAGKTKHSRGSVGLVVA
jgi:hypothetical protein